MVKKITNYYALFPFLTQPTEKIHLSEISRQISEPHPTVRLWLESFVKIGVLIKQTQGRNTQYSLNMNHQNILDHLTITEKLSLISACNNNLALRELVAFTQTNVQKALIFGSASKNFAGANDVDMLIIGKYERKLFGKMSDKLNKELHIISISNINKISKSLMIEIIKKHLIVLGTESFLRRLLWSHWNGARSRRN